MVQTTVGSMLYSYIISREAWSLPFIIKSIVDSLLRVGFSCVLCVDIPVLIKVNTYFQTVLFGEFYKSSLLSLMPSSPYHPTALLFCHLPTLPFDHMQSIVLLCLKYHLIPV